MKTAKINILFGFILFMSFAALSADDGQVVELSFYSGPEVNKLFWPKKDLAPIKILNNPVSIYGKNVNITLNKELQSAVIIDLNDGCRTITKTYKKSPATFTMLGKLGENDRYLPVILDNIQIIPRRKIAAKIFPGWIMKAKVGNKTICLIDANYDGKFDTSGHDCIAINSKYAIRLSRQTSIDGIFYEVEVKPDGSKLTLTKTSEEKLGKITLHEGMKGWQVLTLTNKDATYDITAQKGDIIPAGSYKIGYGVYDISTKNYLTLLPCKDFDPTLEIRHGQYNNINIGAPFSLFFKAKFKLNVVKIAKVLTVAGCHGEPYSYHPYSGKYISPPAIGMCDGRPGTKPKVVTTGYTWSGRIDPNARFRGYSRRVPDISITSGYVIIRRKYKDLGLLAGKVIFNQGETPIPSEKFLIQYRFDKEKP